MKPIVTHDFGRRMWPDARKLFQFDLQGVQPGKHGIYQFWDVQSEDYQPRFTTSDQLGAPAVWEWLSERGFRVNVVNVPMTHPPRPVNGNLITWPLTNTLRFSYPDHLIRDMVKEVGPYLSDLATMYRGEPDYLDKARKYIRMRTKTLLYLQERHPADFNMVVFTEIDRVSHNDFGMEENALLECYRAINEALGEVMERFGTEDRVFCVVSDHGFVKSKADFYIHEFLRDQGFLAFKPDSGDGRSGWYLNDIDWSRTICYMPSPGSYSLNVNLAGRQRQGTVPPERFCGVLEELRAKLLEVRTPDGRPLLKDAVPGREIYTGGKADRAADLVLIPHDYGYMVLPYRSPNGEWFCPAEQNGYHGLKGVFILSAPGVSPGLKPGMPMVDALPQVLYAAGQAIPDHLDGEVRLSLFGDDWKRDRPPTFLHLPHVSESRGGPGESYTEEEKKSVEDRLRALGYLG
jgi:predicted AlkP superfamily phosphohydrolase/phosphomutase